MRKVTLLMHVSLDGLVAGPNGEMDWIHVDEEIFDYFGNIIDQADTALYGRVTYDMMQSYWPNAGEKPNASKHDIEHSRWYMKVRKIVFSKSLRKTGLSNAKVISENIPEEINNLKKETGKSILMLGSPSAAHFFMQHNLIDEYWITVNPVIIGKGIPLFNVKEKINLELLTVKTFSSGVVALHYKI